MKLTIDKKIVDVSTVDMKPAEPTSKISLMVPFSDLNEKSIDLFNRLGLTEKDLSASEENGPTLCSLHKTVDLHDIESEANKYKKVERELAQLVSLGYHLSKNASRVCDKAHALQAKAKRLWWLITEEHKRAVFNSLMGFDNTASWLYYRMERLSVTGGLFLDKDLNPIYMGDQEKQIKNLEGLALENKKYLVILSHLIQSAKNE